MSVMVISSGSAAGISLSAGASVAGDSVAALRLPQAQRDSSIISAKISAVIFLVFILFSSQYYFLTVVLNDF